MPSYIKRHQKWINNLHKQVNDTSNLISNCLQEILAGKTQPVTHKDYLTIMANATIDEDKGLAMEYRHLIKIPKNRPFRLNPLPMRNTGSPKESEKG